MARLDEDDIALGKERGKHAEEGASMLGSDFREAWAGGAGGIAEGGDLGGSADRDEGVDAEGGDDAADGLVGSDRCRTEFLHLAEDGDRAAALGDRDQGLQGGAGGFGVGVEGVVDDRDAVGAFEDLQAGGGDRGCGGQGFGDGGGRHTEGVGGGGDREGVVDLVGAEELEGDGGVAVGGVEVEGGADGGQFDIGGADGSLLARAVVRDGGLGAVGHRRDQVVVGVEDNGKTDRRHVKRKTRADTTKAVRALEKERDAGRIRKAGRTWTVESWLTHWVENIAALHVSENTIDG